MIFHINLKVLIKNILKKIIPLFIRNKIRLILKFFRYYYRYIRIKEAINKNKSIKLIVGAAETFQNEWYSSNENWLDIRNINHWKRIFQNLKY